MLHSWIAIIARLALLDLVVLSYMIMMIPCKLAMIDLIFHKARPPVNPHEGSDTTSTASALLSPSPESALCDAAQTC